MRKHKSVIAILLAAMMIFTFMPTMAFATVTWDDNYKTPVSDVASDGAQKAHYDWDNTTGLITAKSVWSGESTYGQGDGRNAWDTEEGRATGTKNFYDLAGAAFKADNKTIPATLSFENYMKLRRDLQVVLTQPAYTVEEGQTAGKTAATEHQINTYGQYAEFEFGAFYFEWKDNYDFTKWNEDQNVTISFVKSTYQTSGIGDSAADADVLGDLPVINVKVEAPSRTIGHAAFYMDDDVYGGINVNNIASEDLEIAYDGAEHTLSMTPVEGYSVAYAVFNETTGKFDAVDAVKVKEAGYTTVKATITKLATETTKASTYATPVFDIEVVPAAAPTFGFDQDGNHAEGAYYDVPAGTEVNPADYIVITPSDGVANKAAVKANEDTLKELFNDFYTFDSEVKKAAPNEVKYTVRSKVGNEMTATEAYALFRDKYADKLQNFESPVHSTGGYGNVSAIIAALLNDNTEATVYFVQDKVVQQEDDVTITFAPNKTFKAKKKTKKLAASKSFTLEAKAESGKAIHWIITKGNKKISIDEETGKITVKKGLKKGTYSVKVKAKTVADAAYKAAKDTVTIKVKVK